MANTVGIYENKTVDFIKGDMEGYHAVGMTRFAF